MLKFCEQLNKKEKYLLGVSGGPDSMFLLDNFYEAGFKIFVAHVNYQKRIDSNEDELIVVNYCQKRQIPYQVLKVNQEKYDSKTNFQDQARQIRFTFFQDVAKQQQISNLVLGHHFQDHLETYLLQKQRKNIVEYYGLKPVRKIKDLMIIRPMLDITKKEIYAYLTNKKIDFKEDSTNILDIYQRNVFRKKVNLMRINEIENLVQEIKNANICLLEDAKKLKKILVKVIFNDKIKCKSFLSLEKKWQKKLIYQYLKKVNSNLLVKSYLNEILKILTKNKKPNVILRLNNEWIFIKEYEWAYITNETIEKDNYCFVIRKLENFYCKYLSLKLSNENQSMGFYVSEDDFPIYIVPNQGQEKIKTFVGTKKINRLFIEHKISAKDRINWPLIYNRNWELIAIAMLAININFLKTKNNWFMLK